MRRFLGLPRGLWIENFWGSWSRAIERKGPCLYVCTDGSRRACGVGACARLLPTKSDPRETSGPRTDRIPSTRPPWRDRGPLRTPSLNHVAWTRLTFGTRRRPDGSPRGQKRQPGRGDAFRFKQKPARKSRRCPSAIDPCLTRLMHDGRVVLGQNTRPAGYLLSQHKLAAKAFALQLCTQRQRRAGRSVSNRCRSHPLARRISLL